MLIPDRYRAVSVAELGGDLIPAELEARLLGRPSYRRTVYLVARSGERTALLRLERRAPEPLFSEIVGVEVLAGADETAFVVRPDVDTGVPSQLVAAALREAPRARCAVVRGRYEHVSFVLEPALTRVHVVDVAPPHPPKLLDQVRRVLDTAEDLPPVDAVPAVVDLADLAGQAPSAHYLLPCRGGGIEIPGARVSYLDEVPPRADWTLLGCARSQAIHAFFYGGPAPQVDSCPRVLAAAVVAAPGEPVLTKCCLRESGVGVEDGLVVVPWGASVAEIGAGLRLAVETAQRVP